MLSSRERNTLWARERRNQTWIAQVFRTEAETCPRSLGGKRICGYPLQNRVVNFRTVPYCARCHAKRLGLCTDCMRRPVSKTVGKSLRCGSCHKLARLAAGARWQQKHPEKKHAQYLRKMERWMADPALRARELLKKKLWRFANPEKRKQYARNWQQSARYKDYHQQYNESALVKKRERERLRAKKQLNGGVLTHPCVACQEPIAGRAKKCASCRLRAYHTARAILLGAVA